MLATVWQARHDYDLAHVDVYSGRAFLWAEAVCRLLLLAGKPYIVTLRGGNLVPFARRRPRRMARLLCGAAAVTTPSRFLFEQLASVDSEVNRSARSSSVSSRSSFGPFGFAALAIRRSAPFSMPNCLREPPGSRDEPTHRSPADFGSTDQPINRSTAFRLIPNPIDVEAYRFRPRRVRRAAPGLAARISSHLRARAGGEQRWPQLVREFPAVRLTMVGPDKGDGSLARTRRAGRTPRADSSASTSPALRRNHRCRRCSTAAISSSIRRGSITRRSAFSKRWRAGCASSVPAPAGMPYLVAARTRCLADRFGASARDGRGGATAASGASLGRAAFAKRPAQRRALRLVGGSSSVGAPVCRARRKRDMNDWLWAYHRCRAGRARRQPQCAARSIAGSAMAARPTGSIDEAMEREYWSAAPVARVAAETPQPGYSTAPPRACRSIASIGPRRRRRRLSLL